MLTSNRILLCVFLQLSVCLVFVQWLTIQPILLALSKQQGAEYIIYRDVPNTRDKYTPNNPKAGVFEPLFDTTGEINMNLTGLFCRKVDLYIDGPSPYTHYCKSIHNKVTY